MPHVYDVVPSLDVDGVIAFAGCWYCFFALSLPGSAGLYLALSAVFHAVQSLPGDIVSCLFLASTCRVFLQFRLGCHGLPIAADQRAAAHVVRADRLCTSRDAGALGDK